ncbi:MAG: YicC family protein [Deltaproteobacteria bacterium]|nr:YicC family protein [Deltaproteobacteria bacterium]
MIKSMTAYAACETHDERYAASIEIRTYNSRFLDTAVRVPKPYAVLEERVRQTIASKIFRGRVEINISIVDNHGSADSFTINEDVADAFNAVLLRLKKRYNLSDAPSLAHFIQKNGIIEHAKTETDPENAWPIIHNGISDAVDKLDAMRGNEGNAISKDLFERIGKIEDWLVLIEAKSLEMVEHYNTRLREKITSLTAGITEIDPARIAQEAAFLADKSDISEEIVRAKSHLRQFSELMNSSQPAGKPLNFLLQELNREFNTMGSKAGIADIAHIIVNTKTELEKIREQVQNVE